nr:hypothetical protein [Dermabacter vaginalis]
MLGNTNRRNCQSRRYEADQASYKHPTRTESVKRATERRGANPGDVQADLVLAQRVKKSPLAYKVAKHYGSCRGPGRLHNAKYNAAQIQ